MRRACRRYITFTGAPAGGFDATIAGTGDRDSRRGSATAFRRSPSGVDVTKYASGRVFVSLGARLTGLSAGNNYAPNFLDPTGPNFTTRMDKYEITYGLSATGVLTGGANLSSTDFFGIPLKLQTKGGSQPTTLTWNYNGAVNTASVFQSLGALREFPDRHSFQHPRRPRRQRRERRHDQHAWRTHERGGSHHRAKQHEWRIRRRTRASPTT